MKKKFVFLFLIFSSFLLLNACSFFGEKNIFPNEKKILIYDVEKAGEKIANNEYHYNRFKNGYIKADNFFKLINPEQSETFSSEQYKNTNYFYEDETGVYSTLLGNNKNFAEIKKEEMDLIIKKPIKKDVSWEIDFEDLGVIYNKIESVDETIQTPYKTFKNVIKVATYLKSNHDKGHEESVVYNYYAKGYGLIKVEESSINMKFILSEVK